MAVTANSSPLHSIACYIEDLPYYPVPSEILGPNPSTYYERYTQATKSLKAEEESIVKSNFQYFSLLYGKALEYHSNNFQTYKIIPGHFYDPVAFTDGDYFKTGNFGPIYIPKEERQYPVVMVIGKMPSFQEMDVQTNFVGDFGVTFFDVLHEIGFTEEMLMSFYLTNCVRTNCPANQVNALIKEFKPLLENELRILRPDVVLCLGSDALRQFTKRSMKSIIHNPLKYDYPCYDFIARQRIVDSTYICAAPLQALHEYSDYLQFCHALKVFRDKVYYKKPIVQDEVLYDLLSSLPKLQAFVDNILNQKELVRIAIDLEWHGRTPYDEVAYVRCISITTEIQDKINVYIVPVCDTEGREFPLLKIEEIAAQFNRLLDCDNIQIVGHNFIADIPWLEHIGIDIMKKFYIPSLDEIEKVTENYSGIFDTIFAHHAYDEGGKFDLETAAEYLLYVEPWSLELNNFIKEYCAAKKLKLKQLAGYGPVPDGILYPYAARDSYYTLKLFHAHVPNLYSDRYGNNCWSSYWRSMYLVPVFLEMFRNGIKIDTDRFYELHESYSKALEDLHEKLKAKINWPDFNYRSFPQCVEFLFGEKYTYKPRKRPPGARSLGATPIYTTASSSARPWDDTCLQEKLSPATDLEVCQTLATQYPEALSLYHLRVLDQVLKTTLKLAKEDEDDENSEITGGLLKYMCPDGKIHPRYFPLTETRRCSSREPNLQNLSNSREEEYKVILGNSYKYCIRSVLTVDSPGDIFVEVDYSAAELLMMGIAANDTVLIEDYYRNSLPDDHPDKLDLHSNIAVLGFGLNCRPTKAALKAIGAERLRYYSKRVIFGLNYGSSVESCYLQLKLQNPEITLDDVKKLVDTIYLRYTRVASFREEVKARVTNPGWLANCFGSYRRFFRSRSREIIKANEREALNFPCQSGVADAMTLAANNLYSFPERRRFGYRLILHNHDALLLTIPEQNLSEFVNEVVPYCFCEKVKIRPCDLDGKPIKNAKEYSFSYEVKTGKRWGELEDLR